MIAIRGSKHSDWPVLTLLALTSAQRAAVMAQVASVDDVTLGMIRGVWGRKR